MDSNLELVTSILRSKLESITMPALASSSEPGICALLYWDSQCRIGPELIQFFAKSWVHFSGDAAYPIPGGKKQYDASKNLWGGDDLVFRLSFMRHIIDGIESNEELTYGDILKSAAYDK